MARYDGSANLIQNQEGGLTPDRAREIGHLGGVASGQARRQRRQLRELLNDCMTASVTDEEIRAALVAAGYEPNFENALTLAALTRAARGDIEALRYVRDTLGEKPTESYNMSLTAKPLRSLDLSALSDEELEALADMGDDASGTRSAPQLGDTSVSRLTDAELVRLADATD